MNEIKINEYVQTIINKDLIAQYKLFENKIHFFVLLFVFSSINNRIAVSRFVI